MTELATRPTSSTAFTREAVERLSAERNEPSWLRERRLEALGTFDRLPIPSRNHEEYRRTDLRRLNLDDFELASPNGGARLANEARAVLSPSRKEPNGGELV